MRAVRQGDLLALVASFVIALVVSFVISVLAGCSFPRPPDLDHEDNDRDASLPGPEIDAGADAEAPADTTPDTTPDTMPDTPPPPASIAMSFPLRVRFGEIAAVTIRIENGRAGAPWSIDCPAGSGTFAPASGSLAMATSALSIPVQYTAPVHRTDVQPIDAQCSVILGGEGRASASFDVRVRTPQVVGGGSSSDVGTTFVTKGVLFGQVVEVPAGRIVVGLGAYGMQGGSEGRMALYSDVGDLPRDRIVESSVQPFGEGTNEWRVAPTRLTASRYWIMGNFDRDAAIPRSGARVKYAWVSQAVGSGLPAQLGAPIGVDDGPQLGYFLLVVD